MEKYKSCTDDELRIKATQGLDAVFENLRKTPQMLDDTRKREQLKIEIFQGILDGVQATNRNLEILISLFKEKNA